MRGRKSTFFLARVVHIGKLTPEDIARAIQNAVDVTHRRYDWTFIDPVEWRSEAGELRAVFGRLAKYSREGAVGTVDREAKSSAETTVRDLLVASSMFVYLPQYSGIAFQQVWNQIEKDTFSRRFAELIVASLNLTLVEVRLSLVSEYRSLFRRIAQLDYIDRIQARVVLPNPLYGLLWKPLQTYLDEREAGEFSLEEQSPPGKGLKTALPDLLKQLADGVSPAAMIPPTAVSDSAVLMAADGYGDARVRGVEDGAVVEIGTAEMDASFKLEKDAELDALENFASDMFAAINLRRGLEEDD